MSASQALDAGSIPASRIHMTFIKNKEDFECEKCGVFVEGSGYTNHCSECLWSKHVDVNPGDRLEKCCGLMEPVGVEIKNSETVIVHKCQKCGSLRKNRSAANDNQEKIISVS